MISEALARGIVAVVGGTHHQARALGYHRGGGCRGAGHGAKVVLLRAGVW
jgi:hypothetical protein